jgi:hypothetical protein
MKQVLYQTRWLIWRNWMVFSRNKLKTKTKTIITIIMALLLGLICQHFTPLYLGTRSSLRFRLGHTSEALWSI